MQARPDAPTPRCSSLSDQALDIIGELVGDRGIDAGVQRSLVDQLAAFPEEPARALLGYLKAVRASRLARPCGGMTVPEASSDSTPPAASRPAARAGVSPHPPAGRIADGVQRAPSPGGGRVRTIDRGPRRSVQDGPLAGGALLPRSGGGPAVGDRACSGRGHGTGFQHLHRPPGARGCLDREAEAAIAVAGRLGAGVVVTRHDAQTFTVELSPQVPAGTICERDLSG